MLNVYRRDAAKSGVGCKIWKNGTTEIGYAKAPEHSEAAYNGGSASVVVHLEPGDTVCVGNCKGTDNISYHTSFMGFLLQAD